jgi:hypothetical protein
MIIPKQNDLLNIHRLQLHENMQKIAYCITDTVVLSIHCCSFDPSLFHNNTVQWETLRLAMPVFTPKPGGIHHD